MTITLIISKVTFNLNTYTQLTGKDSLKQICINQKSYEMYVYKSVSNHQKFPNYFKISTKRLASFILK